MPRNVLVSLRPIKAVTKPNTRRTALRTPRLDRVVKVQLKFGIRMT